MLRSLSNRLVPESARLVQCLGLALERDRLQAALVDNRDGKPRLLNEWQTTLPHAIDDPERADAGTALADAISKIIAQVEQTYFAVQLALPDPLMQVKVFELESVPGSERARQEFARWRLSKDFHRDVDRLAIRTQTIARGDTPPRLLIEAVEQSVLDRILYAARQAGAVVSCVDMAARFRHEQLDKLSEADGPAALLALERTYWSLLVWDERGVYRQLKARWRDADSAPIDREIEKIIRHADRQLRLFNNEQDHPDVSRIWVQASHELTDSLMTTLSLQTELKCARIPADNGVGDTESLTALAAGWLS